MICARKIYKIPEFCMIFARKVPEFYIIIARKIFSRILGGTCPPPPCPPSPTPMDCVDVGILYNISSYKSALTESAVNAVPLD